MPFSISATIDESPLVRRVITFQLIELSLYLLSDQDEERTSEKYGHSVVRKWDRYDQENNTMEKREVPLEIIEMVLDHIRNKIRYEG